MILCFTKSESFYGNNVTDYNFKRAVTAPSSASCPVTGVSSNPFNYGDYQFMQNAATGICDNNLCNLDFSFGKEQVDVHVRLQTSNCNSKQLNINSMIQSAYALVNNVKRVDPVATGCTNYISWKYVKKSITGQNRIVNPNVATMGTYLV
ncbi:hypothetical protein AYI70_g71 [Smittium culicis]|uniref:Uncharacterized protein n=1 Tax=Smittium culicis TaxID=133412 RepID=A0A1R1YHZ3_9FUNG|nr:hypothetical protein AYI70_g71 [Smittium culicis]